MKEDKLLLKAFNWYYEEGLHTTNISNEDALILFKGTDMYQNYFNLANDVEQSSSNCNIPLVVGRSEQLKAFLEWFDKPENLLDHDELIKQYNEESL